MATDITTLLDALLAGDAGRVVALLSGELQAGRSLPEACVWSLAPALAEVGSLWESGTISVPQEHLATATAEAALARLYAQAPPQADTGQSAVLGCVPGNFHRLGIRTLADALSMNGWHVTDLGANVLPENLVNVVRDRSPTLVCLSMALPDQLPATVETVRQLQSLPLEQPPTILVGGKALNESPPLRAALPGTIWLADPLLVLRGWCHELLATRVQ